jgi:hypothetical protein
MALLRYVNVDRSILDERLIRDNKILVLNDEERRFYYRAICGRPFVFERWDSRGNDVDMVSIVEGRYFYIPVVDMTATPPLTMNDCVLQTTKVNPSNLVRPLPTTIGVGTVSNLTSMVSISAEEKAMTTFGFMIGVEVHFKNLAIATAS